MSHVAQGGIIWMKFRTQFQLTISKNSWNYDFELKRYTSYVSRRYPLNEISYKFQPKISTKLKNFDLEFRCYVSCRSRRYHLNEISYSISTNNKQKLVKLWFWIEEIHVICLKEVSFEWNFIQISAKNKHKIEKFLYGIEVLCVIFLKEVSFEWNFILNFN